MDPPQPLYLSLTASDSPGGTSDLPTAHMLCLSHYNIAQNNTRENCALCLPFFHETRKHRRAKWKYISLTHTASSIPSASKWQNWLFLPKRHLAHLHHTSPPPCKWIKPMGSLLNRLLGDFPSGLQTKPQTTSKMMFLQWQQCSECRFLAGW